MTYREELVAHYCAERTLERRNALIEAYRHLCSRGARKFKRAHNDRADLEQVAALGLIKAASNYRAEMHTPFQAYAWIMVVGELMHYVRDHERIIRPPRALIALEKRHSAAWDAFCAAHHREPSTLELACALDVPVESVLEMRRLRQTEHALRPETSGAGERPEYADVLTLADEGIDLDERVTLSVAVDELGERERAIVLGTYGAGLTQAEIAQRLGLSQSHVSKLLSRALARISSRVA